MVEGVGRDQEPSQLLLSSTRSVHAHTRRKTLHMYLRNVRCQKEVLEDGEEGEGQGGGVLPHGGAGDFEVGGVDVVLALVVVVLWGKIRGMWCV